MVTGICWLHCQSSCGSGTYLYHALTFLFAWWYSIHIWFLLWIGLCQNDPEASLLRESIGRHQDPSINPRIQLYISRQLIWLQHQVLFRDWEGTFVIAVLRTVSQSRISPSCICNLFAAYLWHGDFWRILISPQKCSFKLCIDVGNELLVSHYNLRL